MSHIRKYSALTNISYEVRRGDKTVRRGVDGRPQFSICLKDNQGLTAFERMNVVEAAEAFINGGIDIEGDILSVVRFKREQRPARSVRLASLRLSSLLGTRSQSRRQVQFHYDRPPDFYRLFLDSNLVYSCAYFKNPEWSLERAQVEKLDVVCRKLNLQPDEKFLDIGCGWGSLLLHAAGHYHVRAKGCTLSAGQQSYAQNAIERESLSDYVSVDLKDYRDADGEFHKIASIGMCEHVGKHRLLRYFKHVYGLLRDDGLFLNQCILRPRTVGLNGETEFLQRHIFPGGELTHLGELIEDAERAGFEVLDVENLRPHYALTCRAWLGRLTANKDACISLVGEKTYRTWLLYLAGSAASFQAGTTDVCQVLMAKRAVPAPRPLSRDYMHTSAPLPETHYSEPAEVQIGSSWL